jgi:3'-phosphoadenosine 5'-phosphosulfate sulfotransferase (PAPS reductase)/FAD synthetase
MHDRLEQSAKSHDWDRQLKEIASQDCKYHCLMGISGGFDSSMMLLWAVNNGLNPLVIHFDNGWNAPEAMENIRLLTERLDVDFIRMRTDRKEYDDLCKAFLWAGVPDADIPNDMAMAAMMLRTACRYKIKYILNGHNFRTEGSSPISWSYMDAKYLESVYWQHTEEHRDLKYFPLLTFWEQVWYAFRGITQVRPLYYIDFTEEHWRKQLLELGWKDYGGKHCENIYTEFVGSYYLPRKFGIDKSITYQSALIRSGRMLKSDYHSKGLPQFDQRKILQILGRLGISEAEFAIIMSPQFKSDFTHFKTYHKIFRRYKWLLWILMRMKLIPYTFFKKYTA